MWTSLVMRSIRCIMFHNIYVSPPQDCILCYMYQYIQYRVFKMSDSQLLAKMAELKTITAEYKDITGKYTPATAGAPDTTTGNTDRYTLRKDIGLIKKFATVFVIVF